MVYGPVLHENGLLETSAAAAQKPLLDNIARANTTSYGSVLANYQDCLGLRLKKGACCVSVADGGRCGPAFGHRDETTSLAATANRCLMP